MRTGGVKHGGEGAMIMQESLSVSSMRTGGVKPNGNKNSAQETALSVSSMRTGGVKHVWRGSRFPALAFSVLNADRWGET